MARIFLSPLVVDIRASQADTTFSKWKGINYIRSRVIPANPKTAGQVAVREALARLVKLWQDFDAMQKNNWGYWASGRNYSGFNAWIAANTTKERDGDLLIATKDTGYDQFTTMSAATGGASGEIDVTFTPTPLGATGNARIICRIAGSTEWAKKVNVGANGTSPYTITGLTPATEYQVYAIRFEDGETAGEYVGASDADTATSHA